jgi:hypothetical protein
MRIELTKNFRSADAGEAILGGRSATVDGVDFEG